MDEEKVSTKATSAQDREPNGRENPRTTMEASENQGPPDGGRGAPGLHRIDVEHVHEMLRTGGAPSGYQRLGLMLDTILPRLTAAPGANKPG
jgi:hypothetical protein